MNDRVVNETLVRIAEDFPGWEEWKRQLRAGMDCRIENLRDPNVIMIRTENLGISISSEIVSPPIKDMTRAAISPTCPMDCWTHSIRLTSQSK